MMMMLMVVVDAVVNCLLFNSKGSQKKTKREKREKKQYKTIKKSQKQMKRAISVGTKVKGKPTNGHTNDPRHY